MGRRRLQWHECRWPCGRESPLVSCVHFDLSDGRCRNENSIPGLRAISDDGGPFRKFPRKIGQLQAAKQNPTVSAEARFLTEYESVGPCADSS